MIILVDMDQVLADWSKKYDEILDSYGPRASHIKRARGAVDFNLFEGSQPEDNELILSVFKHKDLYKDLEVIPGSKEALDEMEYLGHDVFIVSSPTVDSKYCASDKFAWLKHHFGIQWASKLILTLDKTVVIGDVLIDDKPEVLGVNSEPFWTHIVFDQSWNRHILDRSRMFHWGQWKDAVNSAKKYRKFI